MTTTELQNHFQNDLETMAATELQNHFQNDLETLATTELQNHLQNDLEPMATTELQSHFQNNLKPMATTELQNHFQKDLDSSQDKTEDFLKLFSNLRNIESEQIRDRNLCIEENVFHFLSFYERHKQNIDRKYTNKIIFSELPNFCFEEQIEDSILVADILRSIENLQPIAMSHLVLFLILQCLTYRILPRDMIELRNEMQQASFSALSYFLHHAFEQRLTFGGKRLTDMIVFTNPLLFSTLFFLSDPRCILVLLQFGLRFEFSENHPIRIHPIFICAVRLLAWFLKQHALSDEGLEIQDQQKYSIENFFHFCRNFKLILISIENPYEMTSQLLHMLIQCSGRINFKELQACLEFFLPYEDFETYQPPSLQHSCRYVIRSRLHENWNLPYGIWRLPLPRVLSGYLNFTMDERGNEFV